MSTDYREKPKNRGRNGSGAIVAIFVIVVILLILDIVMITVLVKANRETRPEPSTEETIDTDETTDETPGVVDTTPPTIRGEANIYVARGSSVRYKSYIYVEDDTDPDPKIEIDNSDVDLSKEGTYKVIYTVTDASGNSATKVVNVVVGAEEEPNVPEDEIYALADRVLETIIEDDMTDLEKVFAVFYYVRNTFSYVKDDNYWEYKQEAYHMMTTLQDNCYANVCVSKLLLERLGFESFMIQGELGFVDEHHYWNMVSIDGGASWYHYDAAWWTWEHDEYPLCMLTDEFAQVISDRHGGLWIYDHDAFPATPKTDLWTVEDLETNPRLSDRY